MEADSMLWEWKRMIDECEIYDNLITKSEWQIDNCTQLDNQKSRYWNDRKSTFFD